MSKYSRTCLAVCLLACLLVLVNSKSVFRADATHSVGKQYVIQPGDDLGKIGMESGQKPEDIAEVNGISMYDPLQAGGDLLIPESSSLIYSVKPGETLWSIAGKNGITVNRLLEANSNVSPDQLQVGQILYLPVRDQESFNLTSGDKEQFAWPVLGGITSKFGWRKGEFHGGIDIAVNTGTDVRASRAGTVVLAGWNAGFGRAVKLDHGDGYCSIYAHNSKLLVQQGQYVRAGQVIAESGNTGRSTGPHVHFELRYNGVAQNPLGLLNNYTQVADIQ